MEGSSFGLGYRGGSRLSRGNLIRYHQQQHLYVIFIFILLIQFINSSHLDDILVGCSEICNTTITGIESKYFPFIEKKVDCAGLWSNKAIDASRPHNIVHSSIPTGIES